MSDYVDQIVKLNRVEVIERTRKRLEQGENPQSIVSDVREGAIEVGHRFENEDYFLADLMRMGDILEEVMELVEPELETEVSVEGTVVIGTVEGDVHNIGKNLVGALLRANGFDVIDLGIDVPKEEFVETIEAHHPEVVGMSGLLTQAHDSMKATVEGIESANLREDLMVIIGGGTIMDDSVREYVGADAYATNVSEGINQIRDWVGVKA